MIFRDPTAYLYLTLAALPLVIFIAIGSVEPVYQCDTDTECEAICLTDAECAKLRINE